MLDAPRLRPPRPPDVPASTAPPPRARRPRRPRPWRHAPADRLHDQLARLADAVLLQAVRDAQHGSASATRFVTDAYGPHADMRAAWLTLAGRRAR